MGNTREHQQQFSVAGLLLALAGLERMTARLLEAQRLDRPDVDALMQLVEQEAAAAAL